MLVLSRKVSEEIKIGDDIVLTVVKIKGNVVRLGITAPDDTIILRSDLTERPGFGDYKAQLLSAEKKLDESLLRAVKKIDQQKIKIEQLEEELSLVCKRTLPDPNHEWQGKTND